MGTAVELDARSPQTKKPARHTEEYNENEPRVTLNTTRRFRSPRRYQTQTRSRRVVAFKAGVSE